MRTRSNRAYSNLSWQNLPFNIPTLMSQAPSSTTTGTTNIPPQSHTSSDSDYTPSPPSPPSPPSSRRRRRRTSLVQQPNHAPRADLVVRNVAVLGVVLAVALLFVHLALYIAIFVVGILAPAWQTYKALEARDRPVIIEIDGQEDTYVSEPREMRNWQAYWVIAAIMLAFDGLIISPFLTKIIPSPLYHSLLFSFVTWLTRNRAGNAAAIYDCYVKPAFQKSESAIDGAVDTLITHVDRVSQQAILAVNGAVAPYARHLEHAAAVAAEQMQDQTKHIQDQTKQIQDQTKQMHHQFRAQERLINAHRRRHHC